MARIVDIYNHKIQDQDIEKVADKYQLPVELLHSIIAVESSGNPFAIRAEPKYRYMWDCRRNRPFRKVTAEEVSSPSAPHGFSQCTGSLNTEWTGQKVSWGPMQVMGAVAREYGFLGHFPVLCSIIGVEYGAQHLKQLARRWYSRRGWEGVVAAYNAGSPVLIDGIYRNQSYVDKVATQMAKHGAAL